MPIPEILKTLIYQYFYINKKGRSLEAILETHSNDDLGPEYISNSSFKDLANNLGINLEEFRFKYSNVSEICEHKDEILFFKKETFCSVALTSVLC